MIGAERRSGAGAGEKGGEVQGQQKRLAVAGSVPFALQTAVLDALLWPAFFPTGW